MEKIINSFLQWMEEKNSSSFYFTYILFLVLYNWRIIYIIFNGTNSDYKERLLRLDQYIYITQIEYYNYFNIITSYDIKLLNILIKIFIYFLPFIVPAFLCFLSIKYLPKINNWASLVSGEFYYKGKLERDRQKSNYIFEKEKELIDRSGAVSKINEEQEKEKTIENSEIFFDAEYEEEISSNNLSNILYQLYVIYYEDERSISAYKSKRDDESEIKVRLSNHELSKILGYADTRGLININDDKISFTNKGKRFLEIFVKEGRHLG